MMISVNKELVELPHHSTLVSLLSQINIQSQSGIAIAVNNQVIKKDKWEEFCLSENDDVLLIKATQGG